jgi:hypothetical protein
MLKVFNILAIAITLSSSVNISNSIATPSSSSRLTFQVREVKGQVKDANGNNLKGATVWIKGSDLYIQTNENGEFRMKLPTEFEAIVVSSPGYKTNEFRITGFENMEISLEKDLNVQGKVAVTEKVTASISSNQSKKKGESYTKYEKKYNPSKPVAIKETSTIQPMYDVCVYGATSAGVVAAYTAAKMGKSVLLVANSAHIGGLSAGGLGQTDIGNKHVIKGVSRDFYRRLGNVYGSLESWQFEPKEASNVFKQYIKDANISFVTNYIVENVDKQNGVIQSIQVKNTEGKSTKKTIKAKKYIDASYEGDLLAAAKVSFVVGREGNAKYNESYNGVYMPKYRTESSGYHQFPDNISPYKVANDPTSGLVFGVQNAPLQENGAADKSMQAYNFRLTLTDSIENQIPFHRPKGYDSTKYELLVRLFEAQPNLREINDYFIWSKMPNRKTDVNNRGGFSTDYIGGNHKYPEASFEERKAIFDDHLNYTQGLLYFYATDSRVPKPLQDYVRKWGYPKDEFVNNNHFTPQLYVREARRMIGDYVMTEHHCLGHELVKDGIAYAAYTMDSHNTQRLIVNGMVKNEGNVEIGGFSPYPISYRSLLPKRDEATNLIVPVCMSASHIAYGSIRMEPVFMLLGQVAGLASVISLDQDRPLHEVDYALINKAMNDDPYIQNGFKDIVLDAKSVKNIQGSEWTTKNHKIYFGNELVVSNKPKKLEVELNNMKPGKYKVYYFVPVVSEIYKDPFYTLTLNGKKSQVDFMDHLNEWFLAGEIVVDSKSKNKLTVQNESHTVFNAVQLVPIVD